jgi:hypothetical protein
MRYKTNEQAEQALLKHIDSKEKGYCAVIALAQVTDFSVSRVYHELLKAGRGRRCGTYRSTQFKALRAMGFENNERVNDVKGMTVNQFTKICDPSQKYLVHVRNHVLAIRGGKVRDWSAGKTNRRKIIACNLIK